MVDGVTSKVNGEDDNSVDAEHAEHHSQTTEEEALSMGPHSNLTLPCLLFLTHYVPTSP